MRTTMTENAYGRCQYHMHVALTHVWNREDCIDVMVVTYEKTQMTYGLVEEITLTPAKVIILSLLMKFSLFAKVVLMF